MWLSPNALRCRVWLQAVDAEHASLLRQLLAPTATVRLSVRCSESVSKQWSTVEDHVGRTPLVRLRRLNPNPSNVILAKLEGNNPAGSVKDRAAAQMIMEAERRGVIQPGDTLIEATSGNTGIALAMMAAVRGYRLKLIMPSNMTEERKASMAAYGAELVEVGPGQMEAARGERAG